MMRASLNRLRRRVLRWLLWRPLFGELNRRRELCNTRISPAACIEHEEHLALGDHVYIGPFNLIEASAGVTIEEGVQITSHVAIVTHSSHRSMRLLRHLYVQWEGRRPGWVSGPVHIGAWTFIGPHTLIEANTRIGRGCIVRAGSVVRGDFPDDSILEGRPARVVGDARDGDARHFEAHPQLRSIDDAAR